MTPAPALPRTDAALAPTDDRRWVATAPTGSERVELRLPAGIAVMLDRGERATSARGSDGGAERFVLPGTAEGSALAGRGACWVIPADPGSDDAAWLIEADAALDVRRDGSDDVVTVHGATATLTAHRARPHADVTGARYELAIGGGELLADALAGFYWGTMIPCVIERTVAADYPDADGYVISTLADMYLGTYPDVDHEFQIKGRLAWGDGVDLDIVRRMLELQLRMMREDPTGLWRDPCAVQPDGAREYHVRRNSMDGRENAVMFLVTGNIGVIESMWMYLARTRDLAWLGEHIEELEGATSLVEGCIDPLGRLWSDVYYEDQVIKDGRETMSASLAIRSFGLLAELEELLGRSDRADRYRARAAELTTALVQPLPAGSWDPAARRFIDWVDRNGAVHDHIHLLANVLPALLGQSDAAQTGAVLELVDAELDEFQRFPTFLAARVQDYDDGEIGDGGPYDLCAAGRYWCWDAAFWSWRGDGGTLLQQLETVARQGERDAWIMGERYDLDHVYYVDGSPWHGAAHYYEYPNVFSWVLLHEYLGVRPALDADLLIRPQVLGSGSVTLEQDAYRLRMRFGDDGLTLENLADSRRTFRVQLGGADQRVELAAGGSVTLSAAGA